MTPCWARYWASFTRAAKAVRRWPARACSTAWSALSLAVARARTQAIESLFVDLFIQAHEQAPEEIVLDLDATDDPLHGQQEGRFFHGYYGGYCYLPLYIFCGRHLLAAERLQGKDNPRFVVTTLDHKEWPAQALYEDFYCARGEMENRIKECQRDLFADRTSTATMHSNQLRLWLSSFAYVLMASLRRLALEGTELARATAGTIRLKLLKIGAVVTVSVRRVKVALSSAYPYQEMFQAAHRALAPTRV